MNAFNDLSISESYGGPLKHRSSVFAYFQESLEKYPDDEAIIVGTQDRDHLSTLRGDHHPKSSTVSSSMTDCHTEADGLCWTFRQLHNASLHFVASLHARGIKAGSMIVRLIQNNAEWCIMFWSGRLGKFIEAPLDPDMLTPPRAAELHNLLAILRPDVIVVADAEAAAAVDTALEELKLDNEPKLKMVLSNGSSTHSTPWQSNASNKWASFLSFCMSSRPLAQEGIAVLETDALVDDSLRIDQIVFTSGTSAGQPKGCPRHVANSICACELQDLGPGLRGYHYRSILDHNGNASLKRRPRMLLPYPNFRVILPFMTTVVWAHGGAVVIPCGTPDPGTLIEAVPKYGITNALIPPSSLNALDGLARFATTDMSTLKTLVLGGDVITQDMYIRAANLFPHCEIRVCYGMSEGASAVHPGCSRFTGQDALRAAGVAGDNDTHDFGADLPGGSRETSLGGFPPFHAGVSSIGMVTPGSRLRVADDENEPVIRGRAGELQLSSPAFIRQYINKTHSEDFYTEQITENEQAKTRYWLKTGDMAIMLPDGWVFVMARKKDVIKRGGLSVVPSALESCLNEFLKSQVSDVVPLSI